METMKADTVHSQVRCTYQLHEPELMSNEEEHRRGKSPENLFTRRWAIKGFAIKNSIQRNPEEIMSQTVVDKTAEQISEAARKASRASTAIGDAIEDGMGVAKRAVKQGADMFEEGIGHARRAVKQSGDAAEEFLNDTQGRMQRHLVLTVIATFAAGVTAGALFGLLMKRD
jgi:hypothetical protein